jgi:hypothetical protein
MVLRLRKVCYVQIWHAHFMNGALQRIEITGRSVMDIPRPRFFSFWLDGPVPAKVRPRRLQLFDRDIIRALREHGKTLGPVDPFEKAPRSTAHYGGTQ